MTQSFTTLGDSPSWLEDIIKSRRGQRCTLLSGLFEASTHLSIFFSDTEHIVVLFLYQLWFSTSAKQAESAPCRVFFPSLFLFLRVQYCTPSLLFKLPCAFLSSSFNLCLLSSPLFPLSYLIISHGFTPPNLLFSPSSLLHQTCSEVFKLMLDSPHWFLGPAMLPSFPVFQPCCAFTTHPLQNPNGSHVSRIPE